MKALLMCEYRDGKLLESSYELAPFADKLGADKAMVLIGKEADAPRVNTKVYLADAAQYGEYNPELHKKIVLEAMKRENPDAIVFLHSSYGWDLAPRVAAALKLGQVSEITGIKEGKFEVGLCNAKLRRTVTPQTGKMVLTIQAGSFTMAGEPRGEAQIEKIELTVSVSPMEFIGYEPAQKREVDLARAEVIVSAGRGVGKKENVAIIAALAKALGGELGASRPVVDAGWVEHSRQVGTTGQIVAPKLYVACGISGAIQHVAGMKKSEFVVAINKDKDAPIGEVADVLVVADVMQFVPALIAKLQK
jgi:electron transfer flavoprotein alpha subunit